MKTILNALLALGLLLGSSINAMADITWTLSDVTFDNGNQAVGTFTTDDAITTFLSFSIDVTGPASAAAFTAAQMTDSYLPGEIGIANADFSQYVDLSLAAPLTSAGGIVPIAGGFDCPGCGTLLVNADTEVIGVTGDGGIEPTAAPEPSAVPFLAGGVILMGMVLRRKVVRAI